MWAAKGPKHSLYLQAAETGTRESASCASLKGAKPKQSSMTSPSLALLPQFYAYIVPQMLLSVLTS